MTIVDLQRKRLRPLASPVPFVGCYSLRLWCDRDHGDDVCADFIGNGFNAAALRAKRAGWRLHRDVGTATCPRCVAIEKVLTKSATQTQRRREENEDGN
jgi:hypothetical protein